jgi:hypothetical protein
LVGALRAVPSSGPRYLVFNNNNKDFPVRNALQARRVLSGGT